MRGLVQGGLEIYRYLPSSSPAVAVFARPGVNIDTSRSNATHLHLAQLSVASTGRYCTVLYCTVLHCTLYCRYRCEVSTEAPMFSTESKYGDLLVIVLPSSPPQVPHGLAAYQPVQCAHDTTEFS